MNLHQGQKVQKSWDSRLPWLPPYYLLLSPLEVPFVPNPEISQGLPFPGCFSLFHAVHFSKQAPEGKESSAVSSQPSAMWEPLTLYLSLGKGLVRKSNLKLASLKGPRAGCAVHNSGEPLPGSHHHAAYLLGYLRGGGRGAVVSSEGVPFPTTQWLCVGFIN